ncbi:MAG: beta-ketoacyl synthase N-terminal-like domain-containing protein [Desulfosalsimonas sp.]|uniref:beta-ketoacyl synthase N-terminal-like domain-containing protein n=1 Tax=Desulfosalsimonas sp. TaxID=3073848 RepID=UPI0039709A1F
MDRRVVITSEAAITPIGDSKETIAANLQNGVSGVKPLRSDDLLSDYIHSKVYGTVDYPITYDFARKYSKTMGPVSYYACRVVRDLLEKSGLNKDFISSGRLGVAFGSTHGSPSVQRNIYRTFFREDPSETDTIGAVSYLKSMVHTTAVNITKMFHITGRVISSSTACTTSSQSIGYGYEMVKYGMQDAMICGGADEYDTTTVAVFDNLLACSTAYNDYPHLTPRPFDEDRDGLVVGEGAGAVLLEEHEFARNRGANIIGEVIGFSCNNNGGDLILPNLEGIRQTIRIGLDSAGIGPEAVDFISAHATATKMGDVIESQAIEHIYGNRPRVSALKSYMGHTMATCGVIETILTLYMMEKGFIAPTLNLDRIDPRCAAINHVQQLTQKPIQTAAVQNFAFGGVNTNLIVKAYSP